MLVSCWCFCGMLFQHMLSNNPAIKLLADGSTVLFYCGCYSKLRIWAVVSFSTGVVYTNSTCHILLIFIALPFLDVFDFLNAYHYIVVILLTLLFDLLQFCIAKSAQLTEAWLIDWLVDWISQPSASESSDLMALYKLVFNFNCISFWEYVINVMLYYMGCIHVPDFICLK